MSTTKCNSCGAPIEQGQDACAYCGTQVAATNEEVEREIKQFFEEGQGGQSSQSVQTTASQDGFVIKWSFDVQTTHSQSQPQPEPQPYTQQPYTQQPYTQQSAGQPSYSQPQYNPYVSEKNKVLAGILAILFGGLGVHKFYLGSIGWGIVYVIFSMTFIPAFVGIIEGIIYLCTPNDRFQAKYSRR
ncbi:TM2 domain-containing protein [Paenibacillus sp. YIM B09110]|uniref:TM2 domain-containing protein n=1 Tax=Paenibacillus sp. YIM B09110 TaxID=3126102 RepID=UPI00301D9204